MKTTFFLISLFFFQKAAALTIASITLSVIADDTIKISMNTEAVELYYFESWQYSVKGNSIILEACFIPGFGSKIGYLNNNFQIPLNTIQTETYHLTVKAYYHFYEDDCLQDSCQGTFSIPFSTSFLALSEIDDTSNNNNIRFSNPSDGRLWVKNDIFAIEVFDMTGRLIGILKNCSGLISLQHLSDGLYFVRYYERNRYKILRIILKK